MSVMRIKPLYRCGRPHALEHFHAEAVPPKHQRWDAAHGQLQVAHVISDLADVCRLNEHSGRDVETLAFDHIGALSLQPPHFSGKFAR